MRRLVPAFTLVALAAFLAGCGASEEAAKPAASAVSPGKEPPPTGDRSAAPPLPGG